MQGSSQLLYKLLHSFSDTTLAQYTCYRLKLFIFCTPSELRTSSRYKNFVTFFNRSPSSVTYPSSSAFLVEPEHFLQQKSSVLLRHFHISQYFLCTQSLHLIHGMELLSTSLLQTMHRNLEVFIDTVLSPV